MIIKFYYQYIMGYSSFWQDKNTGRWYAYHPEHMEGYWSHEAERVPIPTFRELLTRQSDEITFAHQEAVEAGMALTNQMRKHDLLVLRIKAALHDIEFCEKSFSGEDDYSQGYQAASRYAVSRVLNALQDTTQ